MGSAGLMKMHSERAHRYAHRFARRMYLHKLCPQGHAILDVEASLVEMALSAMMESMLADPPMAYEVTTEVVRSLAASYLHDLVEDGELKRELLTELSALGPSDLVPT